MRTFDFAPLFRSTVGFDHLATLLDAANRSDQNAGYPPYNIEVVGKDRYRITLAIAGFTDDELSIESEHNVLKVRGTKKAEPSEEKNFLYQGIAARNFERRYQLADHVKVTNANLANGLLHIELVKELPEAMKPKKIAINAAGKPKLIDSAAA